MGSDDLVRGLVGACAAEPARALSAMRAVLQVSLSLTLLTPYYSPLSYYSDPRCRWT
jgi:hypothetical protein